jgi:hypothetical protein
MYQNVNREVIAGPDFLITKNKQPLQKCSIFLSGNNNNNHSPMCNNSDILLHVFHFGLFDSFITSLRISL